MERLSNTNMIQSKRRAPNIMLWIQVYLIATVLLYLFGPIKYVKYNLPLVLFLVGCYQFALWIGYTKSYYNKKNQYSTIESAKHFTAKDSKLIKRLCSVGIFFDILMMYRMTNSWNPSIIWHEMLNGLLSPANQYENYYETASAGNLGGGALYSLFITFGTPFAIAAIILGIYYFKELKPSRKTIVVFSILVHLGVQLLTGANEGVFDIAIYIVVSVYMRNVNNNLCQSRENNHSRVKKVAVIIIAVILVSVALWYFTSNIIGRTQGNFAFSTLGENKFDPNAGINKYIPEGLLVTFTYLSVYLCEGYYGFSLATRIGWTPMFGMGFSSFIRNNIGDLFGIDLFQYTYQKRIESIASWGSLRNFHTAYTFWANDLSLIGVPIAMFFIGKMLAKYYKKCIFCCDKTAIVMMPIMVTMMFYLPANNKVFVQPSTFLLFFYIVIYNLLKRKTRLVITEKSI